MPPANRSSSVTAESTARPPTNSETTRISSTERRGNLDPEEVIGEALLRIATRKSDEYRLHRLAAAVGSFRAEGITATDQIAAVLALLRGKEPTELRPEAAPEPLTTGGTEMDGDDYKVVHSGPVTVRLRSMEPLPEPTEECGVCDGMGYLPRQGTCRRCHGRGRIRVLTTPSEPA